MTIEISIHAPRTGSDLALPSVARYNTISIHAPRTGSDGCNTGYSKSRLYFNPRSPHGERLRHAADVHAGSDFNPRSPHGERLRWTVKNTRLERFQSTLPARGATISGQTIFVASRFQSTLPARGATRLLFHRVDCAGISIHAPRTGSDLDEVRRAIPPEDFNPRSPHGERRRQRKKQG